MLFSWDDHKNKINQRKHGLSFETARLASRQEKYIYEQDNI